MLSLAGWSQTSFTLGTTGTTLASAAFSPSAGDIIYIVGWIDGTPGTGVSESTPTNSGTALTWHLVSHQNSTAVGPPANAGVLFVYWAFVPAAQSAITVTISGGASGAAKGVAVIGFSGAAQTQTGVNTTAAPNATVWTNSVTTTKAGSWCWFAGLDYAGTGAWTPAAGQAAYIDVTSDGASHGLWLMQESPQPPSGRLPLAVAMSVTDGGSAQQGHAIAFEVIAAAGDGTGIPSLPPGHQPGPPGPVSGPFPPWGPWPAGPAPVPAAPVPIVPVVLRSRPARVQIQPRNLIRTVPAPPPPVPMILRSRPARLLPARRGVVSGPLAPGVVAVVTPVRPVVLTMPRRGPPRAPAMRLATGMLPGKGLSGLPPTAFLRSRPAQVQRQPRMRLVTGYPGALTVPLPQSHVLRQAARLQRQPRMQLRTGMLPGTGLSGLPPTSFLRSRPAQVQHQPRMLIRTGMLSGKGLSGIPPSGPVRSMPARPRIRPPASRIVPPPFVPAGVVYPAMIYPARIQAVVYRLVRRPAGSLRTGMLPGTGIAAVPLGAAVLRGRSAPVPRVRSRIVASILPSPVQPPRPLVMAARLARRPAGRLVTGIVIRPPLGAAVLRHQRPRVIPVRSRLASPVSVIPVYPVVIQQAGWHRRIPSRLVRRLAGYLRTGMLPGALPGFTGNQAWQAGSWQPRWQAESGAQHWHLQPRETRWLTDPAGTRWAASPAGSGGITTDLSLVQDEMLGWVADEAGGVIS